MSGGELERLREAWDIAVSRDRPNDAAAALSDLERLDPEEPRWSHRLGEVLRRLGRPREAEEAFVRATERYVKQGFLPRAIAMAKLVTAMNPARGDLLARLQPAPALQGTQALRAYTPVQRANVPQASSSGARPALLRPAEDSSIDEVRFDDAEPDSSLDLDLSMEEFARSGFAEPAPEPSGIGPLPPMTEPSADRLHAMNTFRLFAGLPREALLALADAADLVELPPGTMLMRRREPADSLFAVIEGTIAIAVPGLQPIYLGEGHVVGEGCLLEEAERQADVRAETSVMALRIEKSRLDEVMRHFTDVEDALFALLARRLITNLLHRSPLFTAFDPQVRVDLAQLFEIRRAAPGTVVCARGKRSDGMYVLLSGTITATSDRGAMRIAPGAAFGHGSLLGADPAPQTVESVSESVLLRLPAAKFVGLAAAYPAALALLSQMEDDAILSPESRRGRDPV